MNEPVERQLRLTGCLPKSVNADRLASPSRSPLKERSAMNQTLAVQTRNTLAKVYLGGVVAFSGFITLIVSIIMIVNRTV